MLGHTSKTVVKRLQPSSVFQKIMAETPGILCFLGGCGGSHSRYAFPCKPQVYAGSLSRLALKVSQRFFFVPDIDIDYPRDSESETIS